MIHWEGIVREHGPAVLRIACRILGVGPDAEDVTQDVFCEAWEIERTKGVENWAGLLRRLAVLRSLDKLRRRRPNVPLAENCPSRDRDGPAQAALARELASRLRQCIRELPEQQAAVFTLFYFEQLNRERIAEALDTTAGAVSTALSKARRSLKTSLSDIYQETNHARAKKGSRTFFLASEESRITIRVRTACREATVILVHSAPVAAKSVLLPFYGPGRSGDRHAYSG